MLQKTVIFTTNLFFWAHFVSDFRKIMFKIPTLVNIIQAICPIPIPQVVHIINVSAIFVNVGKEIRENFRFNPNGN
jgi:hypothetical protein